MSRHHRKMPDWLSPVLRILTILGLIGTVVILVLAWREGYLLDPKKLQGFLARFPFGAPIIFVIIQTLQVIIPIVPGGITLPAGVMMFGPWLGLLYNYVGIVLGSLGAFLIARRYGENLVRKLVPERIYDKYVKKLDSKGYKRFLIIAIVSPIAPDDALCYLTGLSNMDFKTFAWIIILGKPITIAMYSVTVLKGWDFILQYFK